MWVNPGAHQRRDFDIGDAFSQDCGQVTGLGSGPNNAERSVCAHAMGFGRVRLGLLFYGRAGILRRNNLGRLFFTPAGCDKKCDK